MNIDLNSVCRYFFMLIPLFAVVLPLVIMLILNLCIIHGLIRRNVRGKKLSPSQVNVLGTIPILFAITFFGATCYIPELIIIVCEQNVYCLNNLLNPNFGALVTLSFNVFSLNHSFNFGLYCIASSAFRERLKAHLYKLKHNCFVGVGRVTGSEGGRERSVKVVEPGVIGAITGSHWGENRE